MPTILAYENSLETFFPRRHNHSVHSSNVEKVRCRFIRIGSIGYIQYLAQR